MVNEKIKKKGKCKIALKNEPLGTKDATINKTAVETKRQEMVFFSRKGQKSRFCKVEFKKRKNKDLQVGLRGYCQ